LVLAVASVPRQYVQTTLTTPLEVEVFTRIKDPQVEFLQELF